MMVIEDGSDRKTQLLALALQLQLRAQTTKVQQFSERIYMLLYDKRRGDKP